MVTKLMMKFKGLGIFAMKCFVTIILGEWVRKLIVALVQMRMLWQLMTPLLTFDNFVSQKKKGGNTKLELDHYLEDDLMPRTLDFDILNWWKANGPKYPTLQRIARDILAIPVSTVASESAFSTSGRLLSPHRSKLHPKTVEALMCAQNWLWAGIKGTSSTKEEDMDIQNILDDYDDEDESGVTRVEESGNS
uniref:HAT C-terminal dimerisation domain-containing protein n=1 Tax=Fagus sylvatica TaxID=28930 RepID=A0A2N9F051_FAGSY